MAAGHQWNGKLQAVGNGAFSGAISYRAMATALARGYATTSTDTGHSGGSASFALGHPEKVIDFGWRAVHEMTGAAKQLVAASYDSAPRFWYWNGCSAGGRQAMKEAQRFASDYDGIIAGAPGLDWTGRAAQAVRVAKPLQENATARLSVDQLRLVHSAVVRACDALDGVTDGLLENPAQCSFDPVVLQCSGSRGGRVPHVIAGRDGSFDLLEPGESTHHAPDPRACPGSELGSDRSSAGPRPRARPASISSGSWCSRIPRGRSSGSTSTRTSYMRKKRTAARSTRSIRTSGPSSLAGQADSGPWLERSSDFAGQQHTVFLARGETVGTDKLGDSYRLFMVPGMGHCGGGEGPNTFDMLAALERLGGARQTTRSDPGLAFHQWCRQSNASMCPYSQRAVYRGAGGIDDAASFACQVP